MEKQISHLIKRGKKLFYLLRHDKSSTQGIVTRCTYYEQFTMEKALHTAAESNGGLT